MKLIAPLLAVSLLAACSNGTPAEAADTASPDTATPAAEEAAPAPTSPEPSTPAPPVGGDTGTAPAPTPDAPSEDAAYLGRWTGVEGMYLQVTPKPAGGVSMEMQWDLDNRGTFDGSVTAEGLRFMRNGVAETAVRTDGNATGLKYLAGKTNCLTVKSGEGYCKD